MLRSMKLSLSGTKRACCRVALFLSAGAAGFDIPSSRCAITGTDACSSICSLHGFCNFFLQIHLWKSLVMSMLSRLKFETAQRKGRSNSHLGRFAELHCDWPPPVRGEIELVELIMQLGVHFVACPRAVGHAAKQQRAAAMSHHAKTCALCRRHAALLQPLPLRHFIFKCQNSRFCKWLSNESTFFSSQGTTLSPS